MIKKIRDIENLHILLWIIKDASWVMMFKPLGMIMIIPTVSVAVYLTVKSWPDLKERLHNLAVCGWIMANSTWMVGEFYFEDHWRMGALSFFVAGLLCIGWWYVVKSKVLDQQGRDR